MRRTFLPVFVVITTICAGFVSAQVPSRSMQPAASSPPAASPPAMGGVRSSFGEPAPTGGYPAESPPAGDPAVIGRMQHEGYGLAGGRIRLYVFGGLATADYRTDDARQIVMMEEETNLPLPDKNFLYYRELKSGTRWAVGRFPREDRTYTIFQQTSDSPARKWERFDVVTLLAIPPQLATKTAAMSRVEGAPMERPALQNRAMGRSFQQLNFQQPVDEMVIENSDNRVGDADVEMAPAAAEYQDPRYTPSPAPAVAPAEQPLYGSEPAPPMTPPASEVPYEQPAASGDAAPMQPPPSPYAPVYGDGA